MKKTLFVILAVVAVASCKSQYDALLASNDADAKYAAAMDYFNNGKYKKAATLFESLAVLTSNTEKDDTVQFYWGLSNYRDRDYYTAEANFTRFITHYPMSVFTPEAAFLRIDCLYRSTYRYELDQVPTQQALAEISQYKKENPDSPRIEACDKMEADLNERLDRKALEAAKLYYKMENYKSSRIAFRNILKNDPENIYREDILYYTAMSSYKYALLSVTAKQKERYLTFVDDYLNFISEIPESSYRRELDVMYRRAQKALGKSIADDGEDISDRDLRKQKKEEEKALRRAARELEKQGE